MSFSLFKLDPLEEKITLPQAMSVGEVCELLYGDADLWTRYLYPYNRYTLKDANGNTLLDIGTEIHVIRELLLPLLRNQMMTVQGILKRHQIEGYPDPFITSNANGPVTTGNKATYSVNWPKQSFMSKRVEWRVVHEPASNEGIDSKQSYKHTWSQTPGANTVDHFEYEFDEPGAHTVECALIANDQIEHLIRHKQLVVDGKEAVTIGLDIAHSSPSLDELILQFKETTGSTLDEKAALKKRLEAIETARASVLPYTLRPIRSFYTSTDDEPVSFSPYIYLAAKRLDTKDPDGNPVGEVELILWDFTFQQPQRYEADGDTIDEALQNLAQEYADESPLREGEFLMDVQRGILPYGKFRKGPIGASVVDWNKIDWGAYLGTATFVAGLGAAAFGQVEFAVPLFKISAVASAASAGWQISERLDRGTFEWNLQTGKDILEIASGIITLGAASGLLKSVRYIKTPGGAVEKLTLLGQVEIGVDVAQIAVMSSEHAEGIRKAAVTGNQAQVVDAVLSALKDGALLIIVQNLSKTKDRDKLPMDEAEGNRRTVAGSDSGTTPSSPTSSNSTSVEQLARQGDDALAIYGNRPITPKTDFSHLSNSSVPDHPHQYAVKADLDSAYSAYEDALHLVGNQREVAIYRHRLTNEYQINIGSEVGVSAHRRGPQDDGPWETGAWEGVLHFHPGGVKTGQFRMPAAADVGGLARSSGGRTRTEYIEYALPGGGRGKTGYTVDYETWQVTIQTYDIHGHPNEPKPFNTLTEYQDYYFSRTIYVKPDQSELHRALAWEIADQFGARLPFPRPNGLPPAGRSIAGSSNKAKSATISMLRDRAKDDPQAAHLLIDIYDEMSLKDLRNEANKDPIAKSLWEARYRPNTYADRLARKHGPFSQPERFLDLVDRIRAERKRLIQVLGKRVERRYLVEQTPSGSTTVKTLNRKDVGMLAAAQTDIPGIRDTLIGVSPIAGGERNPNSHFAPNTDINTDIGKKTHGHAEQQIADQLDALLKDIPMSDREGKTVWLLVEEQPCPTCAEGLNDRANAPGVLRKLSEAYPEITFEIKDLTRSDIRVVKNGETIN